MQLEIRPTLRPSSNPNTRRGRHNSAGIEKLSAPMIPPHIPMQHARPSRPKTNAATKGEEAKNRRIHLILSKRLNSGSAYVLNPAIFIKLSPPL